MFAGCDAPVGGDSDSSDDSLLRDPGAESVSAPPKFEIGPTQLRKLSGGDGVIGVEISFEITNSGGPGDPDSGIVSIAIDAQGPEIISAIESLPPGSSTVVTHTRELAPGSYQFAIDTGGSRQTRALSVTSPDLVLTVVRSPELGAGAVAFEFQLANVGDETATAITLTTGWSPPGVDGDGGENGELVVPLGFEALSPGNVREVHFEVEIPNGLYQLAVAAGSETIEANTSNNRATFDLGVDYVDIVSTVQSVIAGDWARDGTGVVEIEVLVKNRGLVPSGPAEIGAACSPDAGPDCGQLVELPTIPVGGARTQILTLQLPAGTHMLRVFAGADEDTYLWGPDNVVELEVNVPPQPAEKLFHQSEWNLIGFSPNGDAMIELISSLRNAGSDPIQEPIPIAVACQIEGRVVPNCGAEFSVEMANGFGPTELVTELAVPMGAELHTALRGVWNSSTDYVAPQRILGVDRYVWDCYSDRPTAGESGCSGWNVSTVTKWPKGQPVKYWTTGDPEYVALLEELIAETSGWLNLEFESSQSWEGAQFLAFMGSPKSAAAGLGWGPCLSGDGCASVTVDEGAITSGAIGIWHQGNLADPQVRDRVQSALWRDFFHAATAIETRYTLDAILGRAAKPSILESEMLRLNSLPLVEPGMSMSDVSDLIVFSDQLLEPLPPSDYSVAYRVVHAAIEELSESGSARFSLSSNSLGNCPGGIFGPAVYEIGDLDDALAAIGQFRTPDFVRFIWGSGDYVIDRGTFAFRRDGSQWLQIDPQAPYHATGWLEGLSGIYGLLHSFLRVGSPQDISVSNEPEGRITLRSVIDEVGAGKRMTLTINAETNQVEQYSIDWALYQGACNISILAASGQYGVELVDYEAIRRLV